MSPYANLCMLLMALLIMLSWEGAPYYVYVESSPPSAPHFSNGDEILQTLRNLVNIGHLDVDSKWVLDIGAFNGGFSVAMQNSGIFPRANYFLIEGNLKYANTLRDLGFPHAISIVGEKDAEEVSFFTLPQDRGEGFSGISYDDTGCSMYRENSLLYEAKGIEEKRLSFTIDAILDAGGFGDTNFEVIKFDVQGAELKAMKGAAKLLSRCTNTVAIVETSIVPYNQGVDVPTPLSLQLMMESYGYILVDVVSVQRFPARNGQFDLAVQADYIFLKREEFKLNIEGLLVDGLTWKGNPPPYPCHFELISEDERDRLKDAEDIAATTATTVPTITTTIPSNNSTKLLSPDL